MAAPLDALNKPIANIEAPSAAAAIGDVRQDITPKLAQLVTGQLLKGEILSKLTDGSFTVRVAGITAKMMLPEGTKTGDQVPLRLISTNPRPTFLLEHDGDAHFPSPLPQNYASGPDRRGAGSLNNFVSTSLEEAPSPHAPTAASGKIVPAEAAHADTSTIVNLSGRTEGRQPVNELPGKPGLGNLGNTQTTSTGKLAELSPNAQPNANIADTLADKLSSTPTSLSNTGKFITQILQSAPTPGTKVNIAAQAPVVNGPVELKDTAATAAKLHHQISNSGLFYESHVAEWAQGQRPIADIRSEPQAQLDTPGTTEINSNTTLAPASKEMGQIIHQQLNVLEQNIVRWQGELFPGQKIDWEIKKETQGQRSTQETEEVNWQSTVRFDLPNLGPVTAIINMQANHLGLSIRAEQSATVTALKDHASELSSAMQMAGSPLMSFVVNKNESS